MSCEHLVCAACAGPVDEGRCPSCRAARAHLHPHSSSTVFPPAAIVAIVAMVALILLLISGH